MTSDKPPRTSSDRSRRVSRQAARNWTVVLVVGLGAIYPTLSKIVAKRQVLARLEQVQRIDTQALFEEEGSPLALRSRIERLGPLLASWETIGGCGAGGSGAGGVSIKWIGRNVHGGLFNVTQTVGYMHLYDDPKSTDFRGGYNFTSSTQIGRDLDEVWTASVLIPMVYKYYGDVLHNDQVPSYDISNGGLGDVSFLLARRFGEIRDTVGILSVGFPTGKYNGVNANVGSLLTQEKQLGFGRPNASLTLDHTFDHIWGIVVVGGLASYRGGRNDLGSYRAPNASAYSYVGYYLGPFVPSMGLTISGFTGHDQDVNVNQNTPLGTIAPSAAIEWSSDYVALLVGGSIPVGTSFNSKYAVLPWTVSLGMSVSPF